MGKRNRSLGKAEREYILEWMHDHGEMTTEQVMDMIRPHYIPDYETLKEQAIRRVANNLFRSLRDEQGTRTCFAVKSKSVYVNVDVSKNLENIRAVDEMLADNIAGLEKSRSKARQRRAELEGQLSMEEA